MNKIWILLSSKLYSESLLTKKDKWGDSAVQPEEVKSVLADASKPDEPSGEATAEAEAARQDEESSTGQKPQEKQLSSLQRWHTNLWALVKQYQNCVVQRYLETPCLVRGRKFDIRSFMVIICAKPFFVFSQDGYARISLNEYSTDNFGVVQTTEDGKTTDWPSRITHLTNLAI